MHFLIPLGLFYPVYTNDRNTKRRSAVTCNCLFSVVLYLGIPVAGFDAILDCITYIIGLFLFAIVKSTPCNQACIRLGFVIFILKFTSHVTFSYAFTV